MKVWNNVLTRNIAPSIFLSLMTVSLCGSLAAHADAGSSCHFHGKKEASEETIIRCSGFHKERLAKKGKLDSAWTPINHESVEKVTGLKGNQEWRVVFSNPAASDDTKKKLYLFFALNGNFLAANHTGK